MSRFFRNIVAVTGVIVGFAGSAMAADTDISLCSHPDFKQAFGYDRLLVSQADSGMLGNYAGAGCEMMGFDLARAQNLACTRILSSGGEKWGVFNASANNAAPLTCG